jgi:hypothetical protein
LTKFLLLFLPIFTVLLLVINIFPDASSYRLTAPAWALDFFRALTNPACTSRLDPPSL